MKKSTLLILFLISFSVSSQKKSIEFQIKKEKKSITFKGVNKSDIDQEVVLYFNSINGLFGYSSPITKVIPAKKKIKFIELRFNGKYSYNYSYKTKSKPSEEQKLAWNTKIAPYTFKEGAKLDEGIVVFSKDGCSSCKITKDYFIKNKIDFQFINISQNEENRQLMWKVITENGENLQSVSTPVILVDGRLHHSFKDLKVFLKTLKN